MAMKSFDLSGLPLLEAAVAKMQAAQAATPSSFAGQTQFIATYAAAGQPPTVETTTTINSRLVAMRLAFDSLNRGL
jgi:hypothetical protein